MTALLWVVGFFVVFMPAHRRGIVALPNAPLAQMADPADSSKSDKPFCPLCTISQDTPAPADAPVSCAICHLKANLDTPPTLIVPPVFVDELDYALFELRELELVSAASQHRILGRAPPTHA
ncbi:hypothetical protein [Algisphaera agarilytica]|uniref:Uncharacterized protein n=1 Tax=Algisphaera agarilytica TaxID=1385975 RepID=A0A7X0H9N2_9BACT|nr:hypothetical protein [Algisphaera agarilytica]MBB6431638.1 hypothetical protein [Algisphaera agarilytica]